MYESNSVSEVSSMVYFSSVFDVYFFDFDPQIYTDLV